MVVVSSRLRRRRRIQANHRISLAVISPELRSSIAIKARQNGNANSVLFDCVRQYASEADGVVRALAVKSSAKLSSQMMPPARGRSIN